MPIEQIVALLIAERNRLNRAIEALQGTAKRRGRPQNPLASTSATSPVTSGKKRKRRTAAQRKAQAERMKAYWTKHKKKTKT